MNENTTPPVSFTITVTNIDPDLIKSAWDFAIASSKRTMDLNVNRSDNIVIDAELFQDEQPKTFGSLLSCMIGAQILNCINEQKKQTT